MPFCFRKQHFAENGQSVNELWPKGRFSKWRSPPSWILKISAFGHVTVIRFNTCCSVPNFIKSDDFSQRYDDITIFKMAAVRHLGFLKICSFCHAAFVGMLFCFRLQNFTEIGQSVDELWPKNWFLRWRSPPSWIPKILIFGHVTVTGFNIWCSVPNFNKIGRFFTEIWRFNDFQNGGRLPCCILKICSFCHIALVDMPFCFVIQNFAEIGQLVDDLWPKKRFSRWRPPPSWILKISTSGHVTVIGFNICCSVPNFIKIRWFLPHEAMHKRGLCCHAVCPSVCLSRSWITSERINVSSKFFHRRVATPC